MPSRPRRQPENTPTRGRARSESPRTKACSRQAPLTRLVENLRLKYGLGRALPFFDPRDGGVHARALILLETPGPKAVASGFISRNNPDDTAQHLFELLAGAGIPRCAVAIWNVLPWSTRLLPEGAQIPANPLSLLPGFLDEMPDLEFVLLCGNPAKTARPILELARPEIQILETNHPGMKVKRLHPKLWPEVEKAFEELGQLLGATSTCPPAA